MIRHPRAATFLLLHAALALAAATLLLVAATPPVQAQTQTPTFKIEGSYAGLPNVYEGAEVLFKLTRQGIMSASSVTVEVEIQEPNLDDGGGNNPSLRTREFTFYRHGSTVMYFSVPAYVDGVDESTETSHILRARLVASGDGSYAVDALDEAEYTILDPPANVPRISIASGATSVAEGGAATFTLTRTGDTASALTVQVEVDDPQGFTRGDHWDPPPTLPNSVEFQANSSTATLSLQALDDHRDIPNGPITVEVEPPRMRPSVPYLPGHTGLETSASTTVTDNDDAQELELNFGEEGVNGADASEGDKLAFVVKRRQQDANTGAPVRFTVRVETDRSGADWRLEDWTEDTGARRLYRDYPLEITGTDLEVKKELRVTFNGEPESNWSYWASILPLEDHAGSELTSSEEAQYWTVRTGFRETTIDATNGGASNGSISIDSDVTTVTEGESVVFTLYRIEGPMSKPVTVRVQTSETNRQEGPGVNPSTEYHSVTIEAWDGHAEFTVYPYVDGVEEAGADQLIADILSISQVDGANRYTEGSPNTVNVEINDPPSGSTLVTVAADPISVLEGGSTTVTFTRTGGDTAQPLTVNIRVDDHGRLRGNHWDPAPAIPTQVTIPALSATGTLTLTAPDDERDLETAGFVRVYALPGTGYYLGQSGNGGTYTQFAVIDNDTAQELTFKWGRISPDSTHWEAGESYLACDQNGDNCTPGPAEGTFHYDDDRAFAVSHALKEPHPAHFLVSRRAQDTGKTATFIVRVEHNRDWESPRHSGWPTDPETGNRYQEFPLTLTGNQRQVVGRIEVLDNGLLDHNSWQYSAEIKRMEDAGGTVLSPAIEAQYWTVNGDRKKTIWPDLTLGVHVKLDSVTPKEVPEGQDVTITLERNWGNPLEPHAVQVRTWEPNRRLADGANPTDRVHDVVFPAVPMTDRFVEYVTQTETLTVATWDDSVYEPQDNFKAGLLVPSSITDRLLLLSTKTVRILDDDRATITLSVDDTSITEGDTATFTLTRGNNTMDELIVGVSVDDPGGFLEGNYASEAVEVPSSIVFAAGETTREVAITPPDDWRDILDNAFTFSLAQEPHYDIVGSSSLTVQVADNDAAPQVSISFNQAEVDEGTDLVLEIRRIGEDKNPLEIPITAGLVGDEERHVFGMDAGMSLLTFRYHQPDDSYRGPDHHYTATLHPLGAEFWTPASTTTVTGAILDNDPFVVGVEAYRNNIDEGNLLDYRIFHNGHTGEPLQVRVDHSETGNAVYDSTLGNKTHTIPAGTSYITPGYITHRNDGYDGDAEFTVELLADDAYEINSSYPSGTIIVRNTDPLPVLGFRETSTTVSEGAGTIDVWVDMLTALPSLLTTTVEYSVNDYFTGDGLSVTQSTGTLTFDPGETSAAIPVEVLQNSIAGYKERFHIVLSNPVNAALQDGAANLIHEGVIEDDESTVTLEAQAEAVDEGSDVILTLTRDGDMADELTVWLQVVKTAPQAENRQDTVVFPAGDATVEHTITTTDDDTRAGSHTVTATLLDPPAIGEPRTYWRDRPSSVTVTVRETNLERVNVLTPDLRVEEGESITLELARSGRNPLTVTLEVTETGDYTTGTLPGTVTFGLQQATATVTIPTQDDSTVEDIGKLTVTLVDGTDYRAGWPNSHTFTIYDNDGAKPSVSVTRDQNWVNEGQPVSFTVTRSTPTTDALQARVELNRVRYRVTQADLDDPTRGITTPQDVIHFDTEEITVDFPAGTRTVTVTRQTTDDSLNYGNSTYHATVLNDADDDYVALHNASAFIWVQDDDIPTVTGSSTTSEFFDAFEPLILPFSRTGDVSGRILLDGDITHTDYFPAPLQDETATRSTVGGWHFDPGDSNGVSIGTYVYAQSLGLGGTLELRPRYCPNNPANCGYYPQYQVGTPASINFRYYSKFMGVRITRDKVSVSEGDAATFTLHRHGGKPDSITRPLQVNVLVTQEGDYVSGAAPETVTFAANQATVTLSVPTTDDGVDELDGRITAELLYTGVRPESCPAQDDRYCYRVSDYPGSSWYVRSVTTAVTDNDYVPPDVSVSDAQAGEADGTIEFTVSLAQANFEQAASVDWATAEDGSTNAATSGVDFTAASGTLNFAIGETEKTVTVSLLDDQLDEADETFNLVLSNPSELTLADDTGTGTIRDDDVNHGIAFSHSTSHTEEGDDVLVLLQRLVPQETGEGICYVTIQGPCFSVATSGHPVNTPMTVNLDVTQTGDFLAGAPPATVPFAQGIAQVQLSLPTVDDSTVEADGSLTVNILQGAGYSPVYIGPPDSNNQGELYRTLYLYDNDLAFSIADAQADEAAGQLDFTVSLNAPAPQPVTVKVDTVDGEATSHANVTATSLGQDFEAGTATLTFQAGEQANTFSVVTLDDTIYERDETFTAILRTPPRNPNRYGYARRWSTLTSLADGSAVGTIVDDEAQLTASVSRTYDTVDEGQVGPVRFTVDLAHPTTTNHERNPAIAWEIIAGTATAGEDYQDAEDRLNFPVGTTRGFIDVDIVDDNLFEDLLETFSVELVAAETRLAAISPTEASFEVSIRDNETLTASIAADAENVAEGNDAAFTVTLTGGVPTDDVSVPFETSGTAMVTDDYAAPKGAITFPPGDSSGKAGVLEISAGESKGTITFPVLGDSISDDDETLTVEIFSAATDDRAGTVSATGNSATTTILDQDNLTVSIGDAPSVTEGAVATFTITLSTVSDQAVSAGWATKQAGDALDTGETAIPDKDYAAASGTVSIPAGNRSATFTVATTQDTLVESAETFVVALEEATIGNSSPPEMVPLGVTRAEGTIGDDDTTPTGLTISSVSPNRVDEDAGATGIAVTVALDGTTQFTVATPVTVEMVDRPGVQNNATLGVDYTATTANPTIPAGESSVTATITLTPVDDTLSEDDEIARLSATSTVFADSAGKGVRILDNDVEPGEVALTVAPDTVSESASSVQLTVTGTLDGLSSRVEDTVVSLELAGDTATAGEDFQAATATLTIPAGEMSATANMTLRVLDDDLAEGDETLEVTGAVPGTITARPADVLIEDDDQEPTSISLLATTGPIGEGGGAVTIPVRATLLGGGTRGVDTQVALSVLDVSATVGDDYTAAWDSSTLTIPAGEFFATANLTLTPVEDTVYEGNEQVAVRGLNSDPGLPVNGVRLTIVDNDPQPTTVRLSLNSDAVSEGSNVHFLGITATLEGASTLTSDVNLTASLTGNTQRSQSYLAVLTTPLRIEAGQSSGSGTLYLSGTDDDVEDEDETVTIEGASDHPGLTVLPAQLKIANDDTSGVRVIPTSLTVREGQRERYRVALVTEPTADVVVTIDVPANAGFTVNPGSLTFTPQSWGRKYVSVEGAQDDDGDDEPAAEITHSITSGDTHYRDLSVAGVSVTVRDDDEPLVEVSFGDTTYTVAEGETVDVALTLSADPERQVTVPVTATEQDGASAADYSGAPTIITFNSGETEKTLTFTAIQDTDNDDGESVKLGFGNLPDRVTAGTTSEATVNITDDDVPEVKVSFGAAAYTVAESDDASTTDATENEVAVTVTLDADPERTLMIPITATEQGGAASDDYSNVPAEVTFNSGDTEQTFTFTATPDHVDDDGESVKLAFGATLPDGVTEGATAEAVVTIADDDTAGVTVTPTALPVTEGGTATYTVILDSQPETNVSVTILDPTDNTDVTADPPSLTFTDTDWNTEQTVTVSAAQDNDDQDEAATVKHTVSGYGTVTSAADVAVSVLDDAPETVTVSFEQAAYTVAEGGTRVIKVVLDADPERTVTVPLTHTGEGGASASDYDGVPANAVFNSGDTEKTFTITAAQDAEDDDGESVKLGFGTLPGDVTAGTPAQATVSIEDDDDPVVTVSFEKGAYSVEEGNNVAVAVTLSADPERTVEVTLTKVDQGGATSADYSNVPASVTWGAGDTRKTFTFTATQDTDNDDGESVKLGFGAPLPAGVSAGATSETTVSIADDDVPSVTVSFGQAAYTVAESDDPSTTNVTENEVVVTVNLSADPERTVTIPITATNQGGASSADYSSIPTSVVFNAGDTEKEITFQASPDAVDDDGESVKLSFGTPLSDAVTAGTPAEATVSITDDDVPTVTVSFEESSYTVAEGSSETVKVILSADPERTVEVPITATDMDGVSPDDYSITPQTVVFNSGDTEKTFSFSATQDTEDDDGERVRLNFGTLPERVTSTSPSQAVVSITDDDVPAVTVSFEEPSYTVAEGDTISVKVILSAQPERAVAIQVNATYLGGVGSLDFLGVPTTLNFAANDTEKALTFSATDDSLDDDGEKVRLGFVNLPAGVNKGSTDETTVSITDNDHPQVTVSFAAASYTVAESDDPGTPSTAENEVSVTIKLSADPERSVTIPITATGQGGATASDYSAPNSVVFNAGDTEEEITFRASPDSVDDDGESVKLGFGSTLPARITAGTPAEATVFITDDDVPTVTVSFEESSYAVAEGSSETVKVILSADPERMVTIPLLRLNQDDASSADYSGVPANVVFNSGDTEKTFNFEAIQDTVDDDGESVRISFGTLPDQVSAGTNSRTTISITDDDVPTVTLSFEETAYTVAEGETVAVKATLDADPERTVTIPVTATGQGGATTSDYSVPTSVVFNSGDTEKTFSFAATQDTDNDDGESVTLGFGTSLPDGVAIGAMDETTISITDDDVPSVTVSFEESSYSVDEGSNVAVKVVLSADPERTVTIPLLKIDQGGATSADYSVPANVVFNSGDTEKEITFSAAQDTDNDDSESVKLGFGPSLPTGITAGSPAETTVSITDDDHPQVTVSFAAASYTVAESDNPGTPNTTENEATVTIRLSADPERTVTMSLTSTGQGGATASDYSVPTSVVFNAGDSDKQITFRASPDSDDDDGESVKLGFGTSLPAGVTAGTPSETTVSITDDDVPTVSVSFENTSYSVDEGQDQPIRVLLSAKPERPVAIDVNATYLGGVGSTDFLGVPTTLNFGEDDTEKTLTFTATDDSLDDDGEKVRLGFANLPPQVNAGANSQATVSINDNDAPSVTVSFEQPGYTVAEGDSVTVKVRLSADPERIVTVLVTATGQGGATASDFSVPANVVFNSGDTEKAITFAATQDTVDDDGESVKLGFGTSLPDGVTAGTPAETTISITDDDIPSVTVSFEQTAYTVAEGNSETVKVKLSADPERTVEIPIAATDMDGASSGDYSIVPQTVVFNSGDTEKTFSFSATDDSVDDDGERVRLTFGTLPPRVSSTSPSQAVVSITDDDVPSVTVSFAEPSYTVAEGNTVPVKVVLSADPERTVTIPLTKSNQGGATASDYSVPANVVFNSGDTEKTFDFEATDDTVDDDGESVKLGFGNLPSGVSAGTTEETTVSITDDDVVPVTVSFEQASYTVAEGSTETVKVKLNADPERTVTIPVTTTNQGGASASDYSVPNSVVFNTGDTEKTITFTANQDTADDDGESVKLSFGNLPTGVSAGTTGETTVSITDDDVPSVNASFEESSYTVPEGSSVEVKVTLSADPERTVTIPLLKVNQGGATSGDYSGVPANVVFNSGDTEKTFDFEAIQDTDNDDGESVRISFGTLPDRVSAGTHSGTTVSITDDDDAPSVTVSFEQAAYTVAESDDPGTPNTTENEVSVTIELSAVPGRTVTIPVTATGQGGATNADYSVPNSVVFNAGDTEKEITFQATPDNVDDDGESVKLGFGNLPTGVTAGTTNEATVSITDDDVPSVTVSFEQTAYTVSEGSSETVKVKLSADPERTVEVPISATAMDGVSPDDYSIAPQTVVFNSGDTEKTFSFSATDDSVDDDGERVRLTFGTLPPRVSSTSPSQAVVSITDDDTAGITLSKTGLNIDEGDQETYTVVLNSRPTATVTVTISGHSGTDLTLSGTSLTFTPQNWGTAQTVTVTAAQDEDAVANPRITLTHTAASGGYGSITAALPVTITEKDMKRVTVSPTTLNISEGNSVDYTVVLGTQPSADVTVTVSGHSGTDASLSGSTLTNDALTFTTTNWNTAQTVTVSAAEDNDSAHENPVTLTHAVAGGDYDGLGAPSVSIAIYDNDPIIPPNPINVFNKEVPVSPVPGGVTISPLELTIPEGQSGSYGVTLDSQPSSTVTITVKPPEGADFTVAPDTMEFTTVTWGTTQTVTITTSEDDDGVDDLEGINHDFTGGGYNVTGAATVKITITDNDTAGLTVSDTSLPISEDGSDSFTVKLATQPTAEVTVAVSSSDDGAATVSTEELTFTTTNWGTEQTVTVNGVDDADTANEPVTVSLSASGGDYEGKTATVAVTVTDDDDAPVVESVSVQVSFSAAAHSVTEGGTAEITINLSADPERTVSIPVTRTAGTGLASGDYSGVPATVDFASGDTEKSFILTAVQDDVDENAETLTLGFGALPANVSAGTTTQAVVTIIDSIHVSFGAASYEAYEGGAGALVAALLDSPALEETVIPLTATGMNGATSADWTGVPGSLTFASGDTRKTFTLMAYDDDVEDDGEMVELAFGTLPAGVARGTHSTAIVELMNMEAPTCETAVWCADVEFADSGSDDWSRPGLGLGFHTTQEPYPRHSSLSDNRFTFRGKEYQVWSLFTSPGTHPDVSPGSPGRIPEYSTFSIRLMEVVGDELKLRVDRDHQRDWTLYIDGIALPFTDVVSGSQSGTGFTWHHPKLQDLYANWRDGNTYEIMIAEDPVSERPDPPVTTPTEPRYLRVTPGDGSLVANWKQPLEDGNSNITHYRLQWKLGTETWSDAEEVTAPPSGGSYTEVFHMITGLTNYASYDLRVIAVNGVGDSEPSDEHFGMPQEQSLHITDTVVNGNQLTITYERELDGSSIPDPESFWVLVNGAPRDVTGVSVSGRSVILTLAEPAKRAIRATDVVEFRYVTPPSGSPAIRDTEGNYGYSCEFGEVPSEARNETDPGLLEPVTAEFKMAPASHGGPGSEVVFRIEFSEPVRVDMGPNHAHLLEVEGGKVTHAWWLNRDSTNWEIVLVPGDDHDVKITLPADRACKARGAPCGSGGRRLTTALEHTITGDSGPRETRSVEPEGTGKEGKDDGSKDQDNPGRTGKGTKPDGPPANTSPVGAPAISGEARVGETLTADTSSIKDPDGLKDVAYSYQWTANDEDIEGATGASHVLTANEEGSAIRVRVSFTDNAGNPEVLTSDPTGAVMPEAPAAPQNLTATANGDGSVTLTWDDPGDESVTGYQVLRHRPDEGEAGPLVYVEDTGATGTTYTDDGAAAGVKHIYHVRALGKTGVSANSNPAEVTPNSPATGQPVISGAAQVGETLTADTSGIADADGMDQANFSYQWSAGGSDIDGATGSSYDLTEDEEGLTVQVWVTFTDDAGNRESLTSAPTVEVAGPP